MLQRRHQPRHADRNAGRRDVLVAEAPDQAIVASAARDRAEAHRLAVLARDRKGQLNLEHWPGIVFEAAHDGRIDANTILWISTRSYELCNRDQFGPTLSENFRISPAKQKRPGHIPHN